MIALLDTSADLGECEKELGCPVGQLCTPLTRFAVQDYTRPLAFDNGAFKRFAPDAFLSLLAREKNRSENCKFVAVPDVVASARRTLELFDHWRFRLSGWPLALVMQDGQESLPIPWKAIQAVFIGGSTHWKMSKHAADIIKAAKAMGKWVHVGRVNTPGRFEYFDDLGSDSIDGTGLSRFSWMREDIFARASAPRLFDALSEAQ